MAEERDPSSSNGNLAAQLPPGGSHAVDDIKQTPGCRTQQAKAMTGQVAAAAQGSCDSSVHTCQPGVSPFSMAQGPLSRVGSDSLPDLPRLEQPMHHQARASRLRHQAGPLQASGVGSRSPSGLLKSYPGLEPTSPVQGLLKQSLSRSLSSWLQSRPSIHSAAHSKPLQSRQQSAESMSNMTSAELYPGLERAISNWAQQAQHGRADAQPSSNPASRAASGMYPGLERAISNWTQQAQHDRAYSQPFNTPASRAASGLYPGLERAISNWAQQAQQDMPQPQSTPHAMSGMSDLPGLEQAISSWAQQAQHDSPAEQSSVETNRGPLPVTAIPALLDGPYPPRETLLAQQGQEVVDHASLPPAPVARAMSGMSEVPPRLQPHVPCSLQTDLDSMHLVEEPLPDVLSSIGECLYPGMEHALPACVQRASQQDSPEKVLAPASCPRSMSMGSEAWCPGLERAISNWAQQAQRGILRSRQGASPAQGMTSGEAECLYPGLEQAMTAWAQEAHCEIINRLQSNASDCLYCPGLEPPQEDPPSPEQQPVKTPCAASHADAALAQAIGEAVLAAAKLNNPAAAVKVVAEAVAEVLLGATQAEAVNETAIAVVTGAVSQRTGGNTAGDAPDSAVDIASHPELPDSPKLLSRADPGCPKLAGLKEAPRAQASKILKGHARDLGQHQENKHAKLHQKVGAAEGLRACAGPVAADNAGLDFDSNVCISPFSMRGGSKGVVTPGGPGQTADRMAQALRQRELEQMPRKLAASSASV